MVGTYTKLHAGVWRLVLDPISASNIRELPHLPAPSRRTSRYLFSACGVSRRQLRRGHGEDRCRPDEPGMVEPDHSLPAPARHPPAGRMVGADGRSLPPRLNDDNTRKMAMANLEGKTVVVTRQRRKASGGFQRAGDSPRPAPRSIATDINEALLAELTARRKRDFDRAARRARCRRRRRADRRGRPGGRAVQLRRRGPCGAACSRSTMPISISPISSTSTQWSRCVPGGAARHDRPRASGAIVNMASVASSSQRRAQSLRLRRDQGGGDRPHQVAGC